MKNTFGWIAVLLLGQTSFAASIHTSSMNEDFVISATLYNALKAAVGTVPQVKADGTTFVLSSNLDKLICSASGCTLNWDTASATAPQDSGVFNLALFQALSNWSLSPGPGASDPAVHRVVYAQSGSVAVTVSEAYGSNDQVECLDINGYTDCSLVISELSAGTGADLQKLYSELLSAPSWIQAQTWALLSTVSTPQFSTPGKPSLIQSIHTLYTDLLDDGYVVSANYAYATPIVDSDGVIVSEGITLQLTGSMNGAGAFVVQQAQAQSYVLAKPIP